MASELQQQVLRHKEKQQALSAPLSRGKPSLFLSAREAAAVDVVQIYEAGADGLRELAQYDGRFEAFFSSLLHESSTSLQRELKTKEENAVIDEDLVKLLKLLALYAAQRSAHAVLEYLVRKYRVHELNVDPFIRCLIPYHDTKIFAKAIQLCGLSGTPWSFLEGVKNSGAAMPRTVLVSAAVKNVSLLSALCGIARSAVSHSTARHMGNELLRSGLNHIISFVTAVLTECIEVHAINDAQLRVLYPFIVDGVKGQITNKDLSEFAVQQWLQCSCIIASQISRKASLSSPFIDGVAISLLSKFRSLSTSPNWDSVPSAKLLRDVTMGLVVFLQYQQALVGLPVLKEIIFGDLMMWYSFVDILSDFSKACTIDNGIGVLFLSMVEQLIVDHNQDEFPTLLGTAAGHIICSGLLSSRAVAIAADRLLSAVAQNAKSKNLKRIIAHIGPIIGHISQRYPEEFSKATAQLSDAGLFSGSETWDLIRDLNGLGNSVLIQTASNDGISLLLSLSSPSADIRAAALEKFDAVVSLADLSDEISADLRGLAQSVLRNLESHEIVIASKGWNESILKKMLIILPTSEVANSFVIAFTHWKDVAIEKPRKQGKNVISNILSTLRDAVVSASLCDDAIKVDALGGVSFRSWLVLNLLEFCSFKSASIDDETGTAPKQVRNFGMLQQEAVDVILSLGGCIPLFRASKKQSAINLPNLYSAISKNVRSLVSSRDSECVSVVSTLRDCVIDAVDFFRVSKTLGSPSQLYHGYLGLLELLVAIGKQIGSLTNDSSDVPSIRELFFCFHSMIVYLFNETLATEFSADSSSSYVERLLGIAETYFETDFHSVINLKCSSVLRGIEYENRPSASSTLFVRFLDLSTRNVAFGKVVGAALTSGLLFEKSELVSLGDVAVASSNETNYLSNAPLVYVGTGNDKCPFESIFADSKASLYFEEISAEAKISALHTMALLIGASDLSPSNHEPVFLYVFGVIFHTLRSSVKEIRVAACILLNALKSELSKFAHKPLACSPKSVAAGLKLTYSTDILLGVTSALLANQETLVIDASKVIDILMEVITLPKGQGVLNMILDSCIAWSASRSAMTTDFLGLLATAMQKSADIVSMAWPVVENLANEKNLPSSYTITYLEELVRCITAQSGSEVKNQLELIISILGFGSDNALRDILLEWLSSADGHEFGHKLETAQKNKLFSVLVSENLKSGGSANIAAAFTALNVDPNVILEEIVSAKTHLFNVIGKDGLSDLPSENDDVMHFGGDLVNDISVSFQRFYSTLEAVAPLIRASSGAKNSMKALIAILTNLFDILESTLVVESLSLLVVDYTRGLIIDMLGAILNVAVPILADASAKNSKDSTLYTAQRLYKDVDCLLKLMQVSKMLQIQTSALRVLEALITISPGSVGSHALRSLSVLLSANTANIKSDGPDTMGSFHRSLNPIISSVLKTVSKVAVKLHSSETSGNGWDEAIRAICSHFDITPQRARTEIINIVIDVLGKSSTYSCVSTLMAHTLIAFNAATAKRNTLSDSNDSAGVDSIVISRAAWKKANKMSAHVPHQDIFNLAIDAFLGTKDPVTQCACLVSILNNAHELFLSALESSDTSPSIVKYVQASSKGNTSSLLSNSKSISLALSILSLQFVYKVLENESFHRALLPHVNGWILKNSNEDSISSGPQDNFIAICERSLQLLALSISTQQHYRKNQNELSNLGPSNSHQEVSLFDGTLSGSAFMVGMAQQSWQLSVDVIDSLQRLLDGPTFLTVLQELLSHSQNQVRQKALHILSKRLENVDVNENESVLYGDLLEHVKGSVNDVVTFLSTVEKSLDLVRGTQLVGLAQSGVLCIELLSRHIGAATKNTSLQKTLDVSLMLCLELNDVISVFTKESRFNSDATFVSELLKLQGSVVLCAVSLCGAIGPRALPRLSRTVRSILEAIDDHNKRLLFGNRGAATDSEKRNKKGNAEETVTTVEQTVMLRRSRVLFVRSCVCAIASLSSDLANFMHPFLKDAVRVFLSVCVVPVEDSRDIEEIVVEAGSLIQDVARCLLVCMSMIPSRLAIPTLQELSGMNGLVDVELERNPIALTRFVDALVDYVSTLDRNAIASNIAQLGVIAVNVMGYRHRTGIQSNMTRNLDGKVAALCVQLCLKMTETEVRTLLAHSSEWMHSERDEDTESAALSWLQYSRPVSFFHAVSALNDKMKSIFLPCMVPIWPLAVQYLKAVNNILQSKLMLSSKKSTDGLVEEVRSKKRKAADEASSADNEGSRSLIKELVLLSTDILGGICSCCVNDKIGFITDERFEIINDILPLLQSRQWFDEDEEYLNFASNSVIACLTSLCKAVGKDILWKPMNHALLLMTRDKRRVVRVATIKALHRLFVEVGEEYLILLPECLPFISELLEDSASDVNAATTELVRYIEDISGENLDTYLQ